jgi:serine/threonine protein kinase
MDVPQIIAGRFRIECEIGRGGMGTVYRATHLGLERAVAIKLIKPEFAADPDVAERFMREARTMSKLRHPRAAMIFDAGALPDGRHFIVMEFVEGATLSSTLAREGPFTPQRAVRIAADICDVLAEAHRLGIVHRDLKPSNIMLNERGVCVLDFGVAKVLATSTDATTTHATTGSGVIIGTPRYMSPEQCLGHTVGTRSDLYSLGVLLYEMLAGRPPFVDALPSVVLIKQATAAPPALPKLRADVPRSLALAVHTLLAKHPADRPRDAEATRWMLEKSLTKQARPPLETPLFTSTVAAVNAGRGFAARAFILAATVVALGTLLFVWGRGGSNDLIEAMAHADTDSPASVFNDASLSATTTAANVSTNIPQAKASPPRPLTPEYTRRSTNSVKSNTSDASVLGGEHDNVVAAIYQEHPAGASYLLLMERRGARYRVATRAPLDTPDFRGTKWTAEDVVVNGDGYNGVLCTGIKRRAAGTSYKLVLYVPRTRQTYALRIERMVKSGKAIQRGRFSANLSSRAAAPYRALLQRRARHLVSDF